MGPSVSGWRCGRGPWPSASVLAQGAGQWLTGTPGGPALTGARGWAHHGSLPWAPSGPFQLVLRLAPVRTASPLTPPAPPLRVRLVQQI